MDATRIFDVNGVVKGIDARNLRTPTPLASYEVRFGGTDARPERKPIGWRLTKVVQQGEPPEDVTVTIPWKYCKIEGGEVVEMTQAEKDARDAEIAQKKADDEENETENAYELADSGVLLRAVLICLKQENPALNLPTKAQVKAKFKQLKGW